jgi:hypothetical protein
MDDSRSRAGCGVGVGPGLVLGTNIVEVGYEMGVASKLGEAVLSPDVPYRL